LFCDVAGMFRSAACLFSGISYLQNDFATL
jgi:hypothetical protein